MLRICRSCMFNWIRNSQIFSKVTEPVAFSPAMNKNFCFSAFLPAISIYFQNILTIIIGTLISAFLFFSFFFLAIPHGLWDLSSLTRD